MAVSFVQVLVHSPKRTYGKGSKVAAAAFQVMLSRLQQQFTLNNAGEGGAGRVCTLSSKVIHFEVVVSTFLVNSFFVFYHHLSSFFHTQAITSNSVCLL